MTMPWLYYYGPDATLTQKVEGIRRFREDAGLSKAAVARAAGIDPTHLRLIEDGKRDASSLVIARIGAEYTVIPVALPAEALAVRVDDFGPKVLFTQVAYFGRVSEAIQGYMRRIGIDWKVLGFSVVVALATGAIGSKMPSNAWLKPSSSPAISSG